MNSVSVHIVTFNSEDHIEQCINSVLNQTVQPLQIVVVDNDSKDKTIDIISQFSNQVELIRNDINVGFAAGQNQSIKRSKCDFLLVLNPDVVLEPDYIARLVEFLSSHPDSGSTTGKLLLKSNPSLIDSAGLAMNKARRAFDRGSGEPQINWNQSSEVFGVSGAAAVFSRKMIEDISIKGEFFDESFFAYKEDVDVAWRARLLGWKAYYVSEAVAYHERGWKRGKRTKQPLDIRKYSYINRYRMLIKNEQLINFLLDFPFLITSELLSLGYILLKERALFGAWPGLFRDLPYLINKRKWITEKRNQRRKTESKQSLSDNP